jgi:hypothetical protein
MVRVVSIVGYTRSGSTLLDSMLGELNGAFSAGELHYLWERGLLEGRTCGCGRRVSECDVWSEVLTRAFGDDLPDPHEVMRWQARSVRTRHTPALLAGGRGPIDVSSMRAYGGALSKIYRAIAEVTGCRVVIDSSKRPSDGALTMLLPGVQTSIVHLVRDPRAVVFSWRRSKRELDRDDADMPQQSVAMSSLGWVELNLGAEGVRRKAGADGMLLRYEDLMARPRPTMTSIAGLIGEPADDLPFVDDHTVELGENHTVSGNPGRFRRGTIELSADEEWRSTMRPVDRSLTTALTIPLLARYRYPLRVNGSRRGR